MGGSGDTNGQEAEEKEKEEGQRKDEDGGKAKTGRPGGIREAVAAAAVQGGGAGNGAGVSLCSWEREGLRPLLEVCFAPACSATAAAVLL